MLGLVLRVLLSLAVVLGLFWMVARTGSRRLGGRDRALIRVRGRQALSRGSSLAVVEVGSRLLVVGVSDGGVRLLTEMDPAELAPGAQTPEVTHEVADAARGNETAPDGDFQAAYERASAEVGTRVPTRVAETAAERPVATVQGPLGGSLLSASTWRQAWGTATGRSPGSHPGDAA